MAISEPDPNKKKKKDDEEDEEVEEKKNPEKEESVKTDDKPDAVPGVIGKHFSQQIPSTETDANFLRQLFAISSGAAGTLQIRDDEFKQLAGNLKAQSAIVKNAPQRKSITLLRELPHLLRLKFRKSSPTHSYYLHSRPKQSYDSFPFMEVMQDAVPETIESIYLAVDSSGFEFSIKYDPLEDEFPVVIGPSISSNDIGELIGRNVHDDATDGLTGKLWSLAMMCFLVAMDFGRFVLFGGKEGIKNSELATVVHDRLEKMARKRLFHGGEDKYPHILEVLSVTHPLTWFRDEIHEGMADVPFGISGARESMGHQRVTETAWVNVDGLTAMANRNYLIEHRRMLTRRDDVIVALNACQLKREDFVDWSEHAEFRVLVDTHVDELYSRYSLHATPITEVSYACFRGAMVISEPFLIGVYEHFRDQLLSRLGGSLSFFSPSSALYGILGPHSALLMTGSSVSSILTLLTNRISTFGMERLASLLALEFFPDYTNFETIRFTYGAVDPLSFYLDLLGITTMFSLLPMVFDRNRHVKARIIHDFLMNYLREEYDSVAARGIGTNDYGEVVAQFKPSMRVTCQVKQYFLLDPGGVHARGAQGHLIQDVIGILNTDLSHATSVEQGGYQIEPRHFCVPVAPHMPTGGPLNPLRLDTLFQRVRKAAGEYYNLASRRGTLGSGTLGGNYRNLFAEFERYARSFSELMHYVIAPIMVGVGREPCLPFSSVRSLDDWRAFDGIVEDVPEAERVGIRDLPYQFPGFQTIGTSVCGTLPDMKNMFTLLISLDGPGVSYRRGVSVSEEPNYARFNELIWNNLDLEARFDWSSGRHDEAVRILESFRLAAKVTEGTWMDEFQVFHDLLHDGLASVGVRNYSYKALMRMFGHDTTGQQHTWMGSSGVHFPGARELRLYFPKLCRVVNSAQIGESIPIHHNLVRPYVEENARLLLNLFFNNDYGMIMYRVGAVLSHRFIRALDFQTVHRVELVVVRFSPHPIGRTDPETGNVTVMYSGKFSMDGQEEQTFTVTSVPDLQEAALRFSPQGTRLSIQILNPSAYDQRVRDFIRQLMEYRIADVVLPKHRFILHHSIVDPQSATANIVARDMAVYDSLNSNVSWKLYPLMLLDTSQTVSQVLPGSVTKPFLPVSSSNFKYIATGITSYDQRGYGIKLNLKPYFRRYQAYDGGHGSATTPAISDQVLRESPHLLRTLMPIYYINPVEKPFSFVSTTIDDVIVRA